MISYDPNKGYTAEGLDVINFIKTHATREEMMETISEIVMRETHDYQQRLHLPIDNTDVKLTSGVYADGQTGEPRMGFHVVVTLKKKDDPKDEAHWKKIHLVLLVSHEYRMIDGFDEYEAGHEPQQMELTPEVLAHMQKYYVWGMDKDESKTVH
jgi:hypothetical protein